MLYRASDRDSQDWITLDSLHFFCRAHDLAISFGTGGLRNWVSPFGVVSQDQEDEGHISVAERLSQSLNFEIFPMDQGREVRYFLTREELEEQLREMMN